MSNPKEKLMTVDSEDLIQCIINASQPIKGKPAIEQFKKDFGKNAEMLIKETTMQSRQHSAVIAMRNFHNWIKQQLIIFAVEYITEEQEKYKKLSSLNLLEIAVGRGGDLLKWNNVGSKGGTKIKNVIGIDKEPLAIEEANKRLAENKKKRWFTTNVKFLVGDATRPLGDKNNPALMTIKGKKPGSLTTAMTKMGINKFDIISCQFALHFFFISKIALENVLFLISDLLSEGGIFMGTTVDGEKLMSYFDTARENKTLQILPGPPKKEILSQPLFQITKNFSDSEASKKPFGNAYDFQIRDAQDKSLYFSTLPEASKEYLVNFYELTNLAADVGLEPLYMNPITRTVSETNITNFETIYETSAWVPSDGKYLTENEKAVSFLNSIFMFRKPFK